MDDPILDWDKNVPPAIIAAVKHIREEFGDSDWKCRQTTMTWCYAALHPKDVKKVADAQDYRSALGTLKAYVRPSALQHFTDLIRERTPSATLKAFFYMYQEVLSLRLEVSFRDLLEIAYANADRLSPSPIEWAVWHSNSIVYDAGYQTASWLKGCCDVQPHTPNEGSDESWEWLKWKAPKFVGMKPSLGRPFDAATAWDREDIESSLRLTELFKTYFVLHLRAAVKNCAGHAHLEFAKRPQPKQAVAPVSLSHHAHAEDKTKRRETLWKRLQSAKPGDTLSTDEAALILGVANKTINRWVSEGKLTKGARRGRVVSQSVKRKLPEISSEE